jgi:hypothetical protein
MFLFANNPVHKYMKNAKYSYATLPQQVNNIL